MADRPGIMTGLKRLLLIIFSLHNIKHHIICSEGEARGDVYCYISQTGGGKKYWIRPEDIWREVSRIPRISWVQSTATDHDHADNQTIHS